MSDLARRRALARLLLILGFAMLPLGVFLWLATPGFMGGPPPWYVSVAGPLTGIAGIFIGDVLMWRVYRADPEPGERSWRYRDW